MLAAPPHLPLCKRPQLKQRGFSLTELLVVIGIIVLLVGILLVALGQVQVRARTSRTETVMQQFANACTAFHTEHNQYPGVIPEQVLAQDPAPEISSTENALLHLMGGYRALAPGEVADADYTAFASASTATTLTIGGAVTWELVVDTTKIGEGPRINGKPYPPYFTPGPDALVDVTGQVGAPAGFGLPDLVDSWGQPVLYLRQLRGKGPLVGDPTASPLPQFVMGGLLPYLDSTGLGELGRDQTSATSGSILKSAPDPDATLAKIIAHPSLADQPRGAFCLISAGPDGVFYSRQDGPGDTSPTGGVDDIVTNVDLAKNNPQVVSEYDDVRVFGGG